MFKRVSYNWGNPWIKRKRIEKNINNKPRFYYVENLYKNIKKKETIEVNHFIILIERFINGKIKIRRRIKKKSKRSNKMRY